MLNFSWSFEDIPIATQYSFSMDNRDMGYNFSSTDLEELFLNNKQQDSVEDGPCPNKKRRQNEDYTNLTPRVMDSVLGNINYSTFSQLMSSAESTPMSPSPIQLGYKNLNGFKERMNENFQVRVPVTRWGEHEEVILQGIVIDCNLFYGNQATWEQIQNCYMQAANEFALKKNLPHARKRTGCALKKHYRVMHNRLKEGELSSSFWYEVYHDIWMSDEFNKGGDLVKFRDV